MVYEGLLPDSNYNINDMTFLENYSITRSDDDGEVQRLTSYISCKQQGSYIPLNCQQIDGLIEDCVNAHGTDIEPELFFTLHSRFTPWFKHFELNAPSDEDSEVTEIEDDVIIDYIKTYLSERNMIIKDYYRVSENVDLTTLVWSYTIGEIEYVVMVTPGLSNNWNKLITNRLPIEGISIPSLPIYRSTMTYWGRDDSNTFLSGGRMNTDIVRSIYTDLFKVDSFLHTLDQDHNINPENLTESLIELLDDSVVMNDIDIFKAIGEAYLNVSRSSIPYAMYRWKRRFEEYLKDDQFTFGEESMSLLDMRDHLNRSRSAISWRTMALYLRQYNSSVYDQWHIRWLKESYIDEHTDHHSVAVWLYKMTYDRFQYSSSDDKWYSYANNIWEVDYSHCAIHQVIPTTFRSHLTTIKNSFIRLSTSDYLHKCVQDRYSDLAGSICSVLSKISMVTYISNIVKIAKPIFVNRQFVKLLDADSDTLNTPGQLLRFDPGKPPIVRQATSEDYVTKVTATRYNKNLNWESKSVKMAKEWIEMLFPISSTRNEVLKTLAYLMAGGNRLKKFIIMSGPKDTGKSTFKRILTDVLSDDDQTGYSKDVPISVIAGQPKPGALMPELVQCKNAKTAWFTEPDDSVSLNNGILKGITGGDSFFVRGLYKDGGKVGSDFKLLMQCNRIPLLNSFDRPTLERLFIIPFETIFTIDAPTDPEEQRRTRRYVLNPDFYKQNDLICEGLLWIMVQYIPILHAEGLDHRNSEEMTRVYDAYERVNNYFLDFIDIYLSKVDDGVVASVSSKTVIRQFKMWYRKTYNKQFSNTDEHIIDELSRALGPLQDYNYNGIVDRIWSGWTLNIEDSGSSMRSV